jgi:hypothetical protein
MAEHVAVYCQRPLAWDWQDRVCGLPNYVKETVERVEPCRLSYGSFWRKAAVRVICRDDGSCQAADVSPPSEHLHAPRQFNPFHQSGTYVIVEIQMIADGF